MTGGRADISVGVSWRRRRCVVGQVILEAGGDLVQVI